MQRLDHAIQPRKFDAGPITNVTVVNDDMKSVLIVYEIPEDVANGTYSATVELPFVLLASGTLTRDGELKTLTYDGEPEVNSSITVLAEFENTGEIALNARFSASVLLDDEWIAGLSCKEQIVEVGETVEFVTDYIISAPGEYIIAG